MAAELERAVGTACGGPAWLAPIGRAHGVARWQGEAGGRALFVKSGPAALAARFAQEAAGLAALGAVAGWRVPRPLAHGEAEGLAFLVLERLALVPRSVASDARLGAALAAAHAVGAPRFGMDGDAALGATPQPNGWCDSWLEFLATRRLGHQLALARADDAPAALIDGVARVIEALPDYYAGYAPRPSLLHGDLWSGNAAALADGTPAVFDPAAHFGDREADLAMVELFGGFAPELLARYAADWPFDPGYAVRRDLHQLYHLLNHHHLFGGGYAADALRAVARLRAARR